MASVSRRAFLRGRRVSTSPWARFCQALRAATSGALVLHAEHAASLTLAQAGDAHRALALCAQYGVALALEDGLSPPRAGARPVLWLNPGTALGTCQRLQTHGSAWFIQPGCMLGDLAAAGLPGFAQLPAHWSVAAWLADRTRCHWATGDTACSGIAHAGVLLADGSSTVLGPFGAGQQTPLATTTQRRLVSGLFALVASDAAQTCLQSARWVARYRLDALRPRAGGEPNLAQLLLGHGGNLAWVEWLVLDERLLGQTSSAVHAPQHETCDAAQAQAAQTLDAQVKTLFDPQGLFAGADKLYTNTFT